MTHPPLVFLDIETTGASAHTSRITEIGAVRVEDHQIVGTYKQLINPEERVPSFITRMTGISDDMLWDAPTFRSVADELEVFLSDAVFVAHNVNFDYSFIKTEFARMGNAFNMDRLCTVRLSRMLYPEHRSHRLDMLIERMGLTVANRHRAFDDAEVLYKFFAAEYEKHGSALYDYMHRLIKKS